MKRIMSQIGLIGLEFITWWISMDVTIQSLWLQT